MSLNTKMRRCVIADDLRASRVLLQTWIEPCGYLCESTSNGEEAWVAILSSPPSLVVTDIEMPGASGLDLLCSIRRYGASEIHSIPVIVISSLVDDDIRKFVHDVGGTFFLPKPLDKEVTQRVVNNLADLASVRVELDVRETNVRQDSASKISPTLRRLYHSIQLHGPKFH